MTQLYPILSLEAAKAYESTLLNDDAGKTASAMENAGRAIGEALFLDYLEVREWPASCRILVLAGKGLNTGDALVACAALQESVPGLSVGVILTSPEDSFHPAVAAALDQLKAAMGENLDLTAMDAYLSGSAEPVDVVIDGLYGHGFRPPLNEDVAALIQQINGREDISLRVSIDLPSGMGEATDPNTFIADITYIPGVAKQPCFDSVNAPFVGRIRFLPIDPFLAPVVEENQTAFVASAKAFKSINKIRPAQTDKRDFGHCLIIAGSSQMPGAALMATMGSLQAGAGLVTTLAPASVTTQIAGRVPEAMWRPLSLTPDGGLDIETVRIVGKLADSAQAMLIGPGLVLSRSTIFTLCRVIRETFTPLVLDASALTEDIIAAVIARPLSAGPVIVTPHPGEFARMYGLKEIGNPVEHLMNFSQKFRTVTVLKGSPTYISDGKQLISVPVGGPVLARGGSGDILAGMMTTLLAQNPSDPLGVALAATTWHGAAADLLARERGAVAVQTTEILPHLSSALRA